MATNEQPGLQQTVHGLFLGFPFDQLLHQGCPYLVRNRQQVSDYDMKAKMGVLLPGDREPFTGNIVISGPPGSGKSTLAMQLAVSCAWREANRCVSAYISLESTPDEVISKARPFNWDRHMHVVTHVHTVEKDAAPDELAKMLLRVLTQPESCGMHRGERCSEATCNDHILKLQEAGEDVTRVAPQVLLTSLSPRPLAPGDTGRDVFWTRYHEIENLLVAGHELRRPKSEEGAGRHAVLPLVVIDSLSMMAMRPLDRSETYALLSLFRRHETVGVFVVETGPESPFDSTLTDVLLSLDMAQDNGYSVRTIEVVKSRYRNQVYGRHPFRTVPLQTNSVRTPPIDGKHRPGEEGDLPRHGLVVFPSLHYVVLNAHKRDEPVSLPRKGEGRMPDREEGTPTPRREWSTEPGRFWGVKALDQVLPNNLTRGSVIAIEGPRGTFKTNLAMTFLAEGLRTDCSGILVRLHDRALLERKEVDPARPACSKDPAWPTLSMDVVEPPEARLHQGKREPRLPGLTTEVPAPVPVDQVPGFRWGGLHKLNQATQARWQAVTHVQKATITAWRYEPSGHLLFEVDFKSGALLAEELVQIVWDIIIRQPELEIGRVVLDDVSEIGAAYPFLRKSGTSGELFLPAFAHVMRNHGTDLVVTGTTSDLAEANDAVGRICAVADAVLSCRFADVFGHRHVVVHGEGLIGRNDDTVEDSGSAPPVITMHNVTVGEANSERQPVFDLDFKHLEGLVGFETGRVYRPGLAMYLFEGNETIHKDYNEHLEQMIKTAFASQVETSDRFAQRRLAESMARAFAEERSSSGVSVLPFDSDQSEAMHDSLRVFGRGEPIDKTVLLTLDEFWSSEAASAGWNDGEADFDGPSRFIPLDTAGLLNHEAGETLLTDRPGEPPQAQRLVWPFYANVLLLAYRSDCCDLGKGTADWHELLRHITQGKPTRGKLKDKTLPIRKDFWIDLSAPETRSCALLDAMLTGYRSQAVEAPSSPLATLLGQFDEQNVLLAEAMARQVHSLYEILQLSRSDQTKTKTRTREMQPLPEDAAVYLCWYSQLRELLDRQNHLSRVLSVCPLPGGGFRGDWFIGVVRGSVSPALGRKVVRMVCSKQEEYKRFARGVGLPVRSSFLQSGFHAWPRSTIPVDDILAIHAKANSRADIRNYGRIRSTLSNLGMRLMPLSGPSFDDSAREVREIITRLFKQVRMLQQ